MALSGIRIFRIFGIDVTLHWTFILMLLAVLLLGSEFLFLLFVLLFACVLIHEFSHSVTALRNGVKVREIILLPIGGASIIDELDIDPKVEFNISVVGPISSLLLGGIFGVLVVFSPPGIITEILQFLFIINIFLGVSNLIPAFPMDGGRVLESYLQERMDEYDATMLTVKVSMYMLGLILIGAIAFMGFQVYSQNFNQGIVDYAAFELIYTLIIVFFLYGGAKQEEETAVMRKRTEGLKLLDMVSKDYFLVDSGISMKELYARVKRSKKHRIFTRSGSAYYYVDLSKIRKVQKLQPIGIKDLLVSLPNIDYMTGVIDALNRVNSGPGIAAVTKNGKLMGIVTVQSISAFISLHMASK